MIRILATFLSVTIAAFGADMGVCPTRKDYFKKIKKKVPTARQ